MIDTRIKNQKVVLDHITAFAIKYECHESMLLDFTRELTKKLLERAESEDCYTIDMLEDIERIGND